MRPSMRCGKYPFTSSSWCEDKSSGFAPSAGKTKRFGHPGNATFCPVRRTPRRAPTVLFGWQGVVPGLLWQRWRSRKCHRLDRDRLQPIDRVIDDSLTEDRQVGASVVDEVVVEQTIRIVIRQAVGKIVAVSRPRHPTPFIALGRRHN